MRPRAQADGRRDRADAPRRDELGVEEGARADAQRNREAVLQAAIGLLSEQPGASMQAIADASGVGRSTVYRHFPTREQLLRALFGRVLEESRALSESTAASDRSTVETLRALGPQVMALGERYRFLTAHRQLRDEIFDPAEIVPDDPLIPWIAAAQSRDDLRDDLPALWLLAMIRGLAVAAFDELIAGRVETDEAGRRLGETLATAFLPPPR